MKDFTQEAYDKTAHRYAEKHWKRDAHLVDRQHKEFLEFLKGRKLLDVGCGPGRDTKYFLSKGCSVISIDNSTSMITEAKKRVPEGHFQKMDMRTLAFDEQTFNGIWCCASLIHIKKSDASSVLKEFKRILKKNGVLFLRLKLGRGEQIKKYPDGSKRFFSYYTLKNSEKLVRKDFAILKVYAEKPDKDRDVWINLFAFKNTKQI